jgi:two-component system response regulator CiaR
MNFLVLDIDKEAAASVKSALQSVADIDIAPSCEQASKFLYEKHYDLIVMEAALPESRELLLELRKTLTVPVIILSSLKEVKNKVSFLRAGADDYIEKPADKDELFERVKAVLRRGGMKTDPFLYAFKNLEVNFTAKTVTINGECIPVQCKTYEIFEVLVRNVGLILTKQQLLDRVWGYMTETVPTVVDVNIFRLRAALKPYGLDKHIKTAKSIGYMWKQ